MMGMYRPPSRELHPPSMACDDGVGKGSDRRRGHLRRARRARWRLGGRSTPRLAIPTPSWHVALPYAAAEEGRARGPAGHCTRKTTALVRLQPSEICEPSSSMRPCSDTVTGLFTPVALRTTSDGPWMLIARRRSPESVDGPVAGLPLWSSEARERPFTLARGRRPVGFKPARR